VINPQDLRFVRCQEGVLLAREECRECPDKIGCYRVLQVRDEDFKERIEGRGETECDDCTSKDCSRILIDCEHAIIPTPRYRGKRR